LTDESLRILERFKQGPFLLYLSYYSVHSPFQGRSDLVAKYEKRRAERLAQGKPEFGSEEQVWPGKAARQVRTQQAHAVYGAMVEAMDEQIGRVLAKLDELGIADNTVVIFTSDNGGLSTSEGLPTSNLPLRGGKGWLYEGGVREPLIVRWPGVTKAGSQCAVPVNSTDFYPTFLEIAGLPTKPEQHLDGISFASLLRGGAPQDPQRAICWHYPHYSNQGGFPGGAIRVGDWKLIERYEDGRVSLYNVVRDIGEQNDLAEQEVERVKTMRGQLHAWYRETGAKFLRPKTPNGTQPWRPD
jgi:Arylsulfatase A and related enzymes